ncbi:hypothetical protein ACFODZ_03025 [Marinicella sediminis]|uniref:Uracil-DNA glycosylase-like domain-containing protein n=1 Tax=Marinicella sediminis TaxID=1792834 RepID=A0ABV7JAE8_9GAMM|nr:hypothetical protein [Marinicella sediminis]
MISNELIQETMAYFHLHKSNRFVVSPSLPILFFGDIDAYSRSSLKIVTVGKNPSDNEFKINKDDPYSFCRFPDWSNSIESLTNCLKSYFKNKPLKQWFSCYEPILNGAESSYYDGAFKNRAIHTDLCSPLATDPTWSKLTDIERDTLFSSGSNIWIKLIEDLQPDLILVSIPRQLFEKFFSGEANLLESFKFKEDGTARKKPYDVISKKYKFNSGKTATAVWGMPSNKPFDQISNRIRRIVGERLKDELLNVNI